MTTNTQLYTLNYDEVKTYLWTAAFVVANMALPQLFHLIPQGGIMFAPLSFVILAGSYKFGWKAGLLAALASPVVNNLVFGAPAWGVVPVMALKLAFLAVAAGLTAQYFKKVNLLLLTGVVMTAELLGGLSELALTGGISATIADFTIGWPGLLLQVFGTYALLVFSAKKN
ncbi:MAG: ECF transporter S component [Bacteroidaceae bacterium]|nr:ECF transporter S component [Bacteroidaceae bacterium]